MKEEAIKHLNVLELEPGADFKSVRNSYKLLSMAWHPDRFPSEKHKAKAEHKQKRINSAYHWLKHNQEILPKLNEKPPSRNFKQKPESDTKAKKQSPRTTYNRRYKPFSRVKADDHLLIIDDKKYDFLLIKRAILVTKSKKYIRAVGYFLYLIGWVFLILTIASIFGETINTGLTGLMIFFISMITSPILFFFKDIVKINLLFKNNTQKTVISYKVHPNTIEAEKKYKIARSLVNEINNLIEIK